MFFDPTGRCGHCSVSAARWICVLRWGRIATDRRPRKLSREFCVRVLDNLRRSRERRTPTGGVHEPRAAQRRVCGGGGGGGGGGREAARARAKPGRSERAR